MTPSDTAQAAPPAAAPDEPRRFSFLRDGQPTAGAHMNWMTCAERLDDAECDRVIEACRAFELVPPRTVGEDKLPGHRRSDTRMVMLNEETAELFDLLCNVAEQSTEDAYALELSGITRAPQYVEYRPGWGEFGWHNDYSHGIPNAPRKLTVILQLSSPDEYEGGRLQVMGNEIEDMPDARGSIIVFPSILMHRVTPVTTGLRRALVSWIAGPRHA